MSKVGIYLNFAGDCEAAFERYRSAFGGDFESFQRMREVPSDPAHPIADKEQDYVAHVALKILGGTDLMGTDVIESMGGLRTGNNMTISLELDTLEEGQRLFDALSAGGTDVQPLTKAFWGAYWGVCLDPFGVRWMFNVPE